jgi:hypothetical protein
MSSPITRKAICEPSGDHAGSASSTWETFVMSTGSLPSAFITQMSRAPPPNPVNAIFVPSGDHAGVASKVSGLAVRFVWPVPSEFITQMSLSAV